MSELEDFKDGVEMWRNKVKRKRESGGKIENEEKADGKAEEIKV